MDLRYLFIDFDSFFASVEQHWQPALRGRPVGIVPSLGTETTCCIAASYEAKRRGVKTGTGVREARFLCPDIVFVEGNHRRYVETHHAMIETIEQCLHVEKVNSIDECYGQLPPHWQAPDIALAKCDEIKAALAEKIGPSITCSIGVGPNRFLAKLASKMRKPNGCQFITRADLPGILYAFELEDITGIGRSMRKRLDRHGIRSVRELCAASAPQLARIWGSIHGQSMYRELRGEDLPEVATAHRTLSHSHILPPVLRRTERALPVMHKQLQKACRRLRAMDYYAGGMTISVKFSFAWRWERDVKVFPTQDTQTFTAHLNRLWADAPREDTPTQVRVVLWDLIPAATHTPSLFPDDNHPRRVALQKAMDSLTQRYGNASVYFAPAHEAHQRCAAPMRISFTHIPDITQENDG